MDFTEQLNFNQYIQSTPQKILPKEDNLCDYQSISKFLVSSGQKNQQGNQANNSLLNNISQQINSQYYQYLEVFVQKRPNQGKLSKFSPVDPEPGANRDPFIQSKLLNAFDDEFYSDEEDKSLDISLYRNQLLSNTVKPVFFKEDDVSSRGMVIDCLGNDDYSIISYDTEEKSLKRQFKCKFCDKIFDKSCSLGGHMSRMHAGKSTHTYYLLKKKFRLMKKMAEETRNQEQLPVSKRLKTQNQEVVYETDEVLFSDHNLDQNQAQLNF